MKPLKVLYIAGLRPNAPADGVARGFEALGAQLETIPTWQISPRRVPTAVRVARRMMGRGVVADAQVTQHNQMILERAAAADFVVFTDIRNLHTATLARIQSQRPVFFYKFDDMFNPANQPPNFFALVPLFSGIITTKSYNVAEYLAHGAQRALFVDNAYAPHVHYPVDLTAADWQAYGCDVAFTGTFTPDRADFLAQVVRALPDVHFRIWGGSWEQMNRPRYRLQAQRRALWQHLKRAVQGQRVLGEDMSRVLQCSKINLGLLNKQNRDVQTTRTVEIPASGGFLLAERTDEHQRLFVEGEEFDCFDTLAELVEKIRYYLAHEQQRQQVAAAGYHKVTQGGFRYQDRAQQIVNLYHEITATPSHANSDANSD